MTDQQLEVPFSKVDEWEALFKESPCLAFYAAAQWGYEQRDAAFAGTPLSD